MATTSSGTAIITGSPIRPYTVSGISKYIADFTSYAPPIIKRPIHVLADGTAVFVQVDENDSNSPWGTQNNVAKVNIWQSDLARNTWTKKVSYTLPAGTYSTAGSSVHCGSVVMKDQSIYFVWRDVVSASPPGYSLHGVVFARSGSTWTAPTATELLFQPADRYPFRLDLDINKVTGDIFIGWMYSALDMSTEPIGADILVRKSSTIRTFLTGDYGVGSTGNIHPLAGSEDFTLAVDPASDATTTRLMYMTACSASSKDYGDFLGYQVVRNSDLVTLGKGWLLQGMSAGRGAGRRTSYLFAPSAGKFVLIGMGGVTSGEGYALKFTTTSPISTVSPAWVNSTPIQYTPTKYPMDRSNALYTDVSVTYANDSFAILYHDANPGYFRDIVGKFVGDLLSWEAPIFSWDNAIAAGIVADSKWRYSPAGGVFGGARDADSVNIHDSILVYFSRESMIAPTIITPAAWAHQFNRPWRPPYQVVPSADATVNTATPVVAIYADLDIPSPRSTLFPHFQIASDSGFTTDVKEFTGEGAKVDGTHVEGVRLYMPSTLPQSLALTTGTWYIRARQDDSFGTHGAWWPLGNSFTVSHPPTGSNLSPSGSILFFNGVFSISFSWKFNDPYSLDSQSAYRIVVEVNDDASTAVLDTGKIASVNSFATAEIPETYKNVQLKWHVQLWDADDNAGPFSEYGLFVLADPPVVTVISPADGAVLDSGRPSIQWSTDDPLGNGQVAYRVFIMSEGVLVHDSGWKNGGDQAYTPSDIVLENAETYTVYIAARAAAGAETQVSSTFTTSWPIPADPDITSLFVDETMYDSRDGGYIQVAWQGSNIDADFLSWRLYRRYSLPNSPEIDDAGINWMLVHEEFSASPPLGQSNYTYFDYTAPSGYEVHYTLTQTVVRFGSTVESHKPSLSEIGRAITPFSSKYWLILPDENTPNRAIRLENATADSYTEEYETTELQVIGRGRHIEIGDRLGYSGQLTLALRYISEINNLDDPRRQKLDLEKLRAQRVQVMIRSPFGDLFTASTGDMQFERVAGVGRSEFTNVTLPYKEVYSS